jgi:hypothetical protein
MAQLSVPQSTLCGCTANSSMASKTILVDNILAAKAPQRLIA